MTSIVTRDVPDSVLNTLKERAAQAGQSLQAYVLELLTREAATPTNAELAERMRSAAGLDLTDTDIPGLVEAERERRP
ncbi:antitoxin [Streptomyces sp. DG2A-72]|uniref:FitA-like ribbon-helix-helix domain-containing protein n=1 Tax=Streptomyces sp. DG2A-72 TaxID=3051386 RepID=UPI00265BE6FA|nr:antitoxin [Streptomyces sp. DG2A-72]MDO0937372.1 antitoxin [Streptomyces sp. DG2A-72]